MWKITKNAFFKSNVILTKSTTFCKIIPSNIVGICLRQVEYFAKKMTQYFFDRKPSERSMFFAELEICYGLYRSQRRSFGCLP